MTKSLLFIKGLHENVVISLNEPIDEPDDTDSYENNNEIHPGETYTKKETASKEDPSPAETCSRDLLESLEQYRTKLLKES